MSRDPTIGGADQNAGPSAADPSRADAVLQAVATRLDQAAAGQAPSSAVLDVFEGLMRASREGLTGASRQAVDDAVAAMISAVHPLTSALRYAIPGDDVLCALRCAAAIVRSFAADATSPPDVAVEIDIILITACQITEADARARLRAHGEAWKASAAPAETTIH